MSDDTAAGRTIELEDVPLLAAVVLLPLAFGGVEMWAFRAATFLIALSAGGALAKRGWRGWGLGRGSLWLLPAFALLAWAFLQLVPLPAPLLERVSPAAHRVYTEALMIGDHPGDGFERFEQAALSRVDAPAGPSPGATASLDLGADAPACLEATSRPISLEPGATFERAIWFASLLLAFLVVRARAEDPRRAAVYVGVLAGGLVLLAGVGLLQAFTWNGKLLWFREIPSDRLPFGPYVNRVHFGGMMELAVPMLLGVTMERWRRYGRDAISEPIFVAAAVGATACVVAALASTSKAAALLVGISIVALVLIASESRRVRIGLLIAVPLAVMLLPLIATNTGVGERVESFLDRAGQGQTLEGRGAVWRSAAPMLSDFSVTGSGFGSFAEVFPRYQPRGAHARWTRAHNDYLELALDGGLIAVGLTALLAALFLWRLLRRLRREGWPPLRTGLALGVGSLAAHASIDFNHQVPANALLFVVTAALAVAATLNGRSR